MATPTEVMDKDKEPTADIVEVDCPTSPNADDSTFPASSSSSSTSYFNSNISNVSNISTPRLTVQDLVERLKNNEQFSRKDLEVVPLDHRQFFDFFQCLPLEKSKKEHRNSVSNTIRMLRSNSDEPINWNILLDGLRSNLLLMENCSEMTLLISRGIGGSDVTMIEIAPGMLPFQYVSSLEAVHRKKGTLAVNQANTVNLLATRPFIANYLNFRNLLVNQLPLSEINKKFLEKVQQNKKMFAWLVNAGNEDVNIDDEDAFTDYLHECDRVRNLDPTTKKTTGTYALNRHTNPEYLETKKRMGNQSYDRPLNCFVCEKNHLFKDCPIYKIFRRNRGYMPNLHGKSSCFIHGSRNHSLRDCRRLVELRADPKALALKLKEKGEQIPRMSNHGRDHHPKTITRNGKIYALVQEKEIPEKSEETHLRIFSPDEIQKIKDLVSQKN